MPNSAKRNPPIVLAGLVEVKAVFMTHEQAMSLLEPGGLFGPPLVIPLEVPVVNCLAEQNGVGRIIPLDATGQHHGGKFCEDCPARAPCGTYHQLQSKEAS